MEGLTYREIGDILEEANARGALHRALLPTPLALEMAAVRAHLDRVEPCRGVNGTIYECGVFRGVEREWLAGVMQTGAGTHQAHSAARTAHRDFDRFDLQILV